MKIILISLLLLPLLTWAQEFPFQQEIAGIPVTINGWLPFQPWNFGMYESTPGFGDLDGDGDKDLLVGEHNGFVYYFRNDGTTADPQFTFISQDFDSIQQGWQYLTSPCLADLDADGDLDLIQGYTRFFRNIGTPQNFDFSYEGSLIPTGQYDILFSTLADIDGDGDLDLFCGGWQGKILYARNDGTPQNFTFSVVTTQFCNIDVGYWSHPALCDIDGDGDYDLFIGDENGHIWLYRNDGTPQQYSFTYVTNYFDSISVGVMAAPTFCDIEGDGDYDLFIGRDPSGGQTIGDVFFYRNMGTPQTYNFQYVTSNYLTADNGNYAVEQLVDVNGDGKLDLLEACGNHLLYYRNSGTSQNPSFTLESTAYGGITLQDIGPWFCDIDGDGDMDLVAGTSAIPGPPSLYLYLNRGTPQNPNYVLWPSPLVTGNFTVLIDPTLADINADGKLELFLTDQANHGIFYYENTGTPQWPNFQLDTTCWQGISWAGQIQRYTRFYDIDGDGDLDLFLFNDWMELGGANLRFYRNDGSPQNPVMNLVTATYLPDSVLMACAALGDLDADGHPDMFVGEQYGGMLYFHGTPGSPVNPNPKRPEGPPERMITVLPNPGNSGTTISFVLDHPQKIMLDVYNLLGAKVATLASGLQLPGNYSYTWDASAKASGIYILRFITPDQSISRKITILK